MSVNENMPRFECGVGVWKGPHAAEDAQNEMISKVTTILIVFKLMLIFLYLLKWKFKEQIEKKCGKTFPHLKAISFKRQIVVNWDTIW